MRPSEDEAGFVADRLLAASVHVACVATIVVLALTEQFADLPGAAAALIAARYILRL